MTIKGHGAFWAAAYFILILLYTNAFESYLYSIYFITILFPVVIATAYFFNFYLVPNYLITGRKGKFVLYFIYTLIVSAHLQIIMIFLAFIYLANYQVKAMHPSILDVSKLSMTLYAIVFSQGFLILLRKFKRSESQVEELKTEQTKSKEGFLIVRSERRNKKVLHKEIRYIESLSDYVKIHTTNTDSPIITKAKISHIESELTQNFVRIHRSFVVNLNHVSSFNAEHVIIDGDQLPISRSYRDRVKEILHHSA
ncbi:MAG: LytTR family transcriptional regulator DNA-binding domain-containing protein [Reichenbachiella sp.]|uniref:LytR/AlgR family response regulator transcription factor n=1 Tax=Reichenbachiella sp. TaxID=2184521 RepID=UPI0032641017